MYHNLENAAFLPELKIRPTNHANGSKKNGVSILFLYYSRWTRSLGKLNILHLINEKEY
jgi:hypothetical protein